MPKREKTKEVWPRLGSIWFVLGVLALFALALGLPGQQSPARATHIAPTFLAGPSNQGKTCDDLEGAGQTWTEFKLEGSALSNGPHTDGALSVIISNLTGDSFDWSSNIGVDAVVVKGGNAGSNLYRYDPPTEETSDTGLGVPDPTNNGISHISFCYDLAPNLTLAKSDSPDPVTENTNITYTLTVGNNGNAPTSGTITVTDTLPAGTTFVSASGTGWSCSQASGVVTCTRTTAIPAGQNAPDITIVVTAPNDVCGEITNSASVSGGGDSGSDPDATAGATTTVTGCVTATTTPITTPPSAVLPVVLPLTGGSPPGGGFSPSALVLLTAGLVLVVSGAAVAVATRRRRPSS